VKNYSSNQLRNLVLVGHGGCGKTMLADAMLFTAKATDRLGKVDEGTSVLDYDPEETKRKISINTVVAPCEYNSCKINILDTPGFFDFIGEVKSAVKVADTGVIVACAVSGVEVGTEKGWRFLEENDVARVFYINKMDRENANFRKVLAALQDKFGSRVVPVYLPIGEAENFQGIVDLIRGKAYINGKEGEIPAELESEAKEYYHQLVEAAAEADDDLLGKYLEGEELTPAEVMTGFKKGIAARLIFPVFCGSALQNKGIDRFLLDITEFFPSPLDVEAIKVRKGLSDEETELSPGADGATAALVFKTMADPFVGKLTLFRVYSGVLKSDSHIWNVTRNQDERVGQLFVIKGKNQEPVSQITAGDIGAVAKLQYTETGDTLCLKENQVIIPPIDFPQPKLSMAVVPKGKGDEEKIGSGLARLREEDPSIKVEKDTTTHELILSGLGDLHLEVITSKLQKKFGVEVELKTPKVPYKETIKGTVKVEGKHKKQSGGRGQYGHVWLELEPLPTGNGFEFVDKIFGGAVPKQYIPAVEKGLRETMEEGILAGYPVVDIRATLYDGSYHSVDSSEMAFKIAASMALKKGFMDAKPILLEPVMLIEVTVPEEFMGDIMGDLNKKRGRILGMEPQDGMQIIRAHVPLAEVFQYSIDLRSMTQGRGDFTLTFDHYEEVPGNIAEEVIAAAKAE